MTNPDRSRILSRERVPYLPVLIDTDEYQQEPPLNLTSMMLLAANGMVADDLLSLINLYGHAILPIMKAIEFPKQAEQDQRAALDQVINIQGLTTALRETYNGVPSTTSKLLIAIRSHPGSKDKEDLSYYDFISPYIQLQLTSRLRIIELEAATHLYRSLEPWDKASSLIAWVFENVVHHILSNSLNTPVAKVFHDLHLFHPKSDEEASPITTKKAKERFPLVSTSPVFVDFSELSSLQTAISDLFSSSPTNPPVPAVYLVPENRDNSLFCSVLVEGCGCVWAHGCSQEDILPLQNLHRAIKANEGNPYYRYLCVTPTDKMTTTISSNNPSPMAKNVFYLPLCWDPITKFSSHATFELVLDNEEFDALDVDSPSLYSFNTASS
ncbi:hypothetical protein DL96DRAFT_1617825 [Flagelloscypha sp. PMI_526]|nr:hypothetical protein DL96DRAFT_1617825 [Flagelloscypha sp. PMI_526]